MFMCRHSQKETKRQVDTHVWCVDTFRRNIKDMSTHSEETLKTSVEVDFWHPIESISHQHRCSKFLMKSRIIWSNYDQDQQSKIQGYISLHVTEINDLHFMHHFASFHASFHVISCCILHHFMLYFIHFIARITYIARISRTSFHVAFRTSRISCIAPHITSFYVSFHVISS